MANLISNWRKALMSELKTVFPRAEVVAGRRTGVSRDKVRIAVFSDGYREMPGEVIVARPTMVIRYWPARSEIPTDSPADPEELEEAALMIARRLQEIQASLSVTDLWFFRVESIVTDEDPEEWGIEARLTGFAKNEAVIA